MTAKELKIPFHVSFKHASADRKVTSAIYVEVVSRSGNVGRGEGCPRQYVTGETLYSAFSFFTQIKQEALSISDVESLISFVGDHKYTIDANPAAWCAIEIAILDLMAKERDITIEQLLGLPECSGSFHYSAVMGVLSIDAFHKQLGQYIAGGFHDFKLKLSGNLETDYERLAAFQNHQNIRLRLDANNLWQDVQDALAYLQALPFVFWAIEEPLSPGDFPGCVQLAEILGIRIILDESFLREDQFANLLPPQNLWLPNIRISKMGGLIRSLQVMQEGVKNGFQFIVGAQVGETSILTRAALSLVNAYRDQVVAQEGAFGTHLLEYDLTEHPIMFGPAGLLEIDYRNTLGLGISDWRN